MQVDLEVTQKLVPGLLAGDDIAAMPVQNKDVLKAGPDQAFDQVRDHRQKNARFEGQGARMLHVVFADSCHQAFGNQNMGGQTSCRLFGHDIHTAPVMFHGHVFQVLFDGRHGKNTGLEFSALHADPELSPCQFSQTNGGCAYLVHVCGRVHLAQLDGLESMEKRDFIKIFPF